MEAVMMVARQTWTDERMDDLSGRVEPRLEGVQREFVAVRSEVRNEFQAVRSEIFETRQLMIQLVGGLGIALLALGFALVIAVLVVPV